MGKLLLFHPLSYLSWPVVCCALPPPKIVLSYSYIRLLTVAKTVTGLYFCLVFIDSTSGAIIWDYCSFFSQLIPTTQRYVALVCRISRGHEPSNVNPGTLYSAVQNIEVSTAEVRIVMGSETGEILRCKFRTNSVVSMYAGWGGRIWSFNVYLYSYSPGWFVAWLCGLFWIFTSNFFFFKPPPTLI